MTRLLLAPLLSLLFFACGADTEPMDTDENAVAVTDAPITGAFAPANEAFEAGDGPARIGGMLMQQFESVSDPSTGLLDETASRNFVAVATKLADKYPDDTLAALPLYRAAEVVRALNDPKRAAKLYEQIHTNYPEWSKAAESLFMLAFTYDEDLGNLEAAKATYEKFLAMYPDNVFAEATPMLIANLGKSDEEILRQLEEQGQ